MSFIPHTQSGYGVIRFAGTVAKLLPHNRSTSTHPYVAQFSGNFKICIASKHAFVSWLKYKTVKVMPYGRSGARATWVELGQVGTIGAEQKTRQVISWAPNGLCNCTFIYRTNYYIANISLVEHSRNNADRFCTQWNYGQGNAPITLGPQVWNCLPPEVTSAPSLASFRTRL